MLAAVNSTWGEGPGEQSQWPPYDPRRWKTRLTGLKHVECIIVRKFLFNMTASKAQQSRSGFSVTLVFSRFERAT